MVESRMSSVQWLVVLQLLCCTLCSGLLTINEAATRSTVQPALLSSYEGEYFCLPPNFQGTVSVVRFGLTLCNWNTSDARRLSEYPLYASLRTGTGEVLSESTLRLPYLRDVNCSGRWRKFFVPNSYALSPGCCCSIPNTSPCFWIALPNASSFGTWPVVELQLQFQESTIRVPIRTASLLETAEFRHDDNHKELNPTALIVLMLAAVVIFAVPYGIRCRESTVRGKKTV